MGTLSNVLCLMKGVMGREAVDMGHHYLRPLFQTGTPSIEVGGARLDLVVGRRFVTESALPLY